MQTDTQIPLTIYAEMTPNPNTMKFVANKMLVQENAVAEYKTIEETEGSSPIANALFKLPFVNGVFITRNFLTVNKAPQFNWDDITYELRIFISEFLNENPVAVTKIPEKITATDSEQPVKQENWSYTPTINSETDQQIVDLLEQYVKPAVENDGGAIHFKSFNNGIVTVMLKGACSGCPSSTETLKGGVEQLLRSHLKEVTEVVAEAH